jgi:hypothetical protein
VDILIEAATENARRLLATLGDVVWKKESSVKP